MCVPGGKDHTSSSDYPSSNRAEDHIRPLPDTICDYRPVTHLRIEAPALRSFALGIGGEGSEGTLQIATISRSAMVVKPYGAVHPAQAGLPSGSRGSCGGRGESIHGFRERGIISGEGCTVVDTYHEPTRNRSTRIPRQRTPRSKTPDMDPRHRASAAFFRYLGSIKLFSIPIPSSVAKGQIVRVSSPVNASIGNPASELWAPMTRHRDAGSLPFRASVPSSSDGSREANSFIHEAHDCERVGGAPIGPAQGRCSRAWMVWRPEARVANAMDPSVPSRVNSSPPSKR